MCNRPLHTKIKACFDQGLYLKGACHVFFKTSTILASVTCVASVGCTSYYRITDQSTRRTYFATGYDRTSSGAVQFYDEKSRADVTLQSSEIVEISRDEFNSGLQQ
jgi:hypothetical protein